MFKSLNLLWFMAPVAALIALIFARILYINLIKKDEGTPLMKEIADYVKEGAMAYLHRQYKVTVIVFGVIFIILLALAILGIQNIFVPFIFLSGGLWSGVCGYLGMKTATQASSRTACACQTSLNKGLKVSFRAGAIMGLIVVGFGLLDISVWFLALNWFYKLNIFGVTESLISKMPISSINFGENLILLEKYKLREITTILLSYSMGASVMALFSRVGGGIFTKAADVGADLVGKVEAGIPEDDPRNPAVIADNVGDNVGDVAGMGADLYESYCGSILAATALGTTLAFNQTSNINYQNILAPMIVAGAGIIFSLIAIFFVKTKEEASQKELLKSLHFGTNLSGLLILLFLTTLAIFNFISWGIFFAITIGLLSGILIGLVTEYYTSDHYKPTKIISESCEMGAAPAIIQGMSTGMLSTGLPVIIISIGIISAFWVSGGFQNISQGIYGIAFSAIGMLSTLGITLATDAFGPIADNAGGNAEMAGLDPKVRERTDALDALGNTTAATGKGFAIGSAALTALALISAYLDSIKLWISHFAKNDTFNMGKISFTNQLNIYGEGIYNIGSLGTKELVELLNITIANPQFIIGLMIGGMTAFVFCALTIQAVGKTANLMVNEVRRQFKEISGILEGKAKPNYAACVDIATKGAQKTMIYPSTLAIITPILTGLLLNIAGVLGLLIGCLSTGFSLAILLNNSGGAWDNAKKNIEKNKSKKHGKGSASHKASVIGDTVGDPFKDTAGPSLNILLKLMTIVSIVFAGLIVKFGLSM